MSLGTDTLLDKYESTLPRPIHKHNKDNHFGRVSSVNLLSRDHWSPVLLLLYGSPLARPAHPQPDNISDVSSFLGHFLCVPKKKIVLVEGKGLSRRGVKEDPGQKGRKKKQKRAEKSSRRGDTWDAVSKNPRPLPFQHSFFFNPFCPSFTPLLDRPFRNYFVLKKKLKFSKLKKTRTAEMLSRQVWGRAPDMCRPC